jgi:hypothetical protein
MINVINNFLDNKEFNELNNRIKHKNFPWYFDSEQELFYHDLAIVNKKEDLFMQSPFVNLITPFVHPLKIEKINLAKLIFRKKTNKIFNYGVVEDVVENDELYTSNVRSYFFLNSCNAHIQLINYDKIDYVENRILTISRKFPHFTTSHTDIEFCAVLIIDYTI